MAPSLLSLSPPPLISFLFLHHLSSLFPWFVLRAEGSERTHTHTHTHKQTANFKPRLNLFSSRRGDSRGPLTLSQRLGVQSAEPFLFIFALHLIFSITSLTRTTNSILYLILMILPAGSVQATFVKHVLDDAFAHGLHVRVESNYCFTAVCP